MHLRRHASVTRRGVQVQCRGLGKFVIDQFLFLAVLNAVVLQERLELEGALFIVSRSSVPRSRVVVLNRLAPNNLLLDITSTFEQQQQGQFLTTRDAALPDSVVHGLWFPDVSEMKRIAEVLARACAAAAKAAERAAAKDSGVGSVGGAGGADSADGGARRGKRAGRRGKGARPPADGADVGRAEGQALLAMVGGGDRPPAADAPREVVSRSAAGSTHGDGMVLTKEQLRLALIDMCDDSDFISKLHETYLRRVKR